MDDQDTQFDALLGGNEDLPSSVTIARFAACRSQEIQIMKNSLTAHSGTKLAFQTLPKHMRRRAMSHNVKRLPRRLRQIHLNQMKKSGMPAKQKRPSRKYRRRPRNLTEEYTKRANKRYKWLQTHIWHAKRFHMVEKWGFKLPYRPCDKAFRACYRAMTQHCLLQDISYINCIEISGNKELIFSRFKQLCRPDGGLSIGARAFIRGKREGLVTLYEIEEARAIGNVNFQWHPTQENNDSKLWLWIHPSFFEILKRALTQIFHDSQCMIEEIGSELSRFRLTGPLANAVLHDALVPLNMDTVDATQLYVQDVTQIIKNQHEYWININNVTSASDISPHLILALIVKDPRLYLPKKRVKSVPEFKNIEHYDIPCDTGISPLWNTEFRKRANDNKLSDSQIASLQSKLLVPGSDLTQNGDFVPVILIQQPGNKEGNVGLGSGWDIILPSVWAKTFWVALIMRGARVGGLRESASILFEMGKSQFLQPDTKAGIDEQLQASKENTEHFFRKPPNKRINYNKFKIASPFKCDWKMLTQEWNDDGAGLNDFTVLKDKTLLNSINVFLNSKIQLLPSCPKNCLIPVRLECEKRGCPAPYAIMCLPKFKGDFKGVTEPSCDDKFQLERKELRRSHKSLLKRFRKERKTKLKGHKTDAYEEALKNYTKRIRALWLPEPITIRHSCSREVIGFVTKGGFSFSLGKSSATGYITTECLPFLIEFRNKILFRNTNSRHYTAAKLTVILD